MDHPRSQDHPSKPFVERHLGTTATERDEMLGALGYASTVELLEAAIPKSIIDHDLELPPPLSETEALAMLASYAAMNQPMTSMIGLGYFACVTPTVIRKMVIEDPAWYSAYTPYQPEIAQGHLEAVLMFQTLVEDLTGLPVANASLLDEASASAEAMLLCRRANPTTSTTFLADRDCMPQSLAVLATRAAPLGIDLVVDEVSPECVTATAPFGVLVGEPGASGALRDLRPITDAAHGLGALVAVATDLLALTLVRPPGEMGADIALGSAQRFGVPMGYGGPHAAFFAVRSGLERQLPGRLVGVSLDAAGRRAFRLALQTREQHIRRERATSNICTSQVLLAVVAAFYAAYHGPEGLTAIARRVHDQARSLAGVLVAHGLEVGPERFFDTITVTVPGGARDVVARAGELGVNLRLVDEDRIGISCDETTTFEHLDLVAEAFGSARLGPADRAEESATAPDDLGWDEIARRSSFLSHDRFNSAHGEVAMTRLVRRLSRRDYGLDRGMIPLGSCTMKLNASSELEPIAWPGFADLHPFAPAAQAAGYRRLIGDLEDWLAEVSGYDAVSLQPNAGSQGELAGLLAIRGYLRDAGETGRDLCLVPESAHGTNAASARLAGFEVVVVACDDRGNVDLADLSDKLASNSRRVACAMVTYPSTHGVYEEAIVELCEIVHRDRAQVYVDGANLNALMGWARPGRFGADVSHLNLHKTFCIPHGGGGPGVGAVGVRSHLSPYLPGHPFGEGRRDGALVSSPFGSAGILPISWAYLAMSGATGLRACTEAAVLAANYVALRLESSYPVLYRGPGGLVAHECILDLRDLWDLAGIRVEDVAKRLIDYGFHAPTMSFPVIGTLMVEPTESEPRDELDRFCEAMISIRREIDAVSSGRWPRDDNPLVNAPHTAEMLTESWDHPYTREEAVYPIRSAKSERADKYWPPVRRIDGAYGDRHLFCSCPPPATASDEPE